MGSECSTCQNCQKKDEIQLNEDKSGSQHHMNSYPQNPKESEDEENDGIPVKQQQEIEQQYEQDSQSVPKADREQSKLQVETKSEKNQIISSQQQPQSVQEQVLYTDGNRIFEITLKESNRHTSKYFRNEEGERSLSNKREKRPPFVFKSGAQYTGEWIGTQRDGFGVQVWTDQAKYEGEWRQNKACGKGKFWYADGDYFDGSWKDDKANGYGVYLHTNGAKYEGNWKDDLQDGYGTETWQSRLVYTLSICRTDGSRYEGFYKNGKKEGLGFYVWSDGSKYYGYWYDNKIQGFGIYSWLDGRVY